jgi:hypothetical protein
MKAITDLIENRPRSRVTLKFWQAMGPRGNLVRNLMRKHLSRQIREDIGSVAQQIRIHEENFHA